MGLNWQLSIFTSELNFIGIPISLILLRSHKTRYRLRVILALIRTAFAWAWIITPKTQISALVFLGISLAAHVTDAAVTVDHEIELDERNELAFALSHVSIVNFALDVPGLIIGTRLWWQHSLIALTNLVALSIAILGGTWTYDYARAWHCYGKKASLESLDSGYCMTWPGITHPPRRICSAGDRDGPAPGCSETTLDIQATLSPIIHFVIHALVLSTSVYLGMIPAKLRALKQF